MAWFPRITRLGTHMVYGQQAQDSCGIACVIMVNYLMKKWELPLTLSSPVRQEFVRDVFRSESEIDAAYSKVVGYPYNGSSPTYAGQLASVLNELNIGHWQALNLSAKKVPNMILSSCFGAQGAPVIALVNWRDGGGHFVVCDMTGRIGGQTCADFCDPYDTAVHTLRIARDQAINYQVHKESSTSAHLYWQANDSGPMDGWVICRTQTSNTLRSSQSVRAAQNMNFGPSRQIRRFA
jgi:hypothetical protein